MSKPLSCRYSGTARALLCAALADAEAEAVAEVRREWCRAKALLMAASPTRVGNTSTCSPLLAVKHNSRGGPSFRGGGGGSQLQGGWRFKVQGSRVEASGQKEFQCLGQGVFSGSGQGRAEFKVQGRGEFNVQGIGDCNAPGQGGFSRFRAYGLGSRKMPCHSGS